MRRLLPYPILSLSLFLLWLLLNQTLAASHILVAAALAVGGGLSVVALELPPVHLRRPRALLRLLGLVLHDIVRSNIAVARIVLGPRPAAERSGFMDIPLELRAPFGLTMLGIIITATPGTLWVGFDSARGVLTIHVLDLVDESAWIATIKGRYERLLMEVFE